VIQTDNQYITDSETLMNILIVTTIGTSVLVQTLKDAYFYMCGKKGRNAKDYKEAYVYVNGSGLQVTIEEYHLAYDAEKLKGTFFWQAKQILKGTA